MQINRLFEMVYILLNRKRITARELAEHFEVSQRTIFRDVDTLSTAGIPIYTMKGKGGGISLLPDFVLNKTVVTEGEKEEIISSLKAMKAVNFNRADTALSKMSSLFGSTAMDWIEVDFSSWANAEEEKETFNSVKSSILEKRVIDFSYAGANGRRERREAEPLKLCFKGGAWYLYGYCRMRDDFRFFKLRRIRELDVSRETFLRKAPEQIFTGGDVFQEEMIKLKLWISAEAAYRVYDEFDRYEQQPDGSFIAEILYPKGEWIFFYVSSFAGSCEVLEPVDVRDEMKEKLQNMLEKYL